MKIRIKNFILLAGIMFVLLVSLAYSTKIFGFEELRFDGALLINSTTLSIKTNDISRLFVNSDGNVGIGNTIPNATLDVSGIGKFNDGLNISTGPGQMNLTINNGTGTASVHTSIFHNGSGICIGSC